MCIRDSSITSANKSQLNGFSEVVTPRKKPIKANGNANIECANNTSEKYFFIIYFNIVIAKSNATINYSVLLLV